jgi:long-chain acyl-CoA synthetase
MVSYADKPWVKHYDPGVPASLAPYPDVPVFQLLDETAKKHPDSIAVITPLKLPIGIRHHQMSYAELAEASDRLAGALAAMGVKKGDRVAMIMPNCTQFVVAFFGILKAGGTVVALDPRFPPAKWSGQFQDSEAEIAIVLSRFYEPLNTIRDQTKLRHVIVTNIKEYFPPLGKLLFTLAREKKEGDRVASLHSGDVWLQETLAKHSPSQRPKVQISSKEDTAIFQYTGGTTGFPKAARGPHSALVANTLQMRAWLAGDVTDPAKERMLAAIPLFHVYGMVAVMNFAVSMGSTMIMIPNARDVPHMLEMIQTYKPTMFHAVPALYNLINYHPDVIAGKFDLSSIRACVSGSAPLAPETKRRFEELTGGIVMEGFGMSEAPTATHCNPLKGTNRGVGLPMPDVECRIVSLDDGVTDMPVGEIGELIIRGPVMMSGYHKQPTETANTLRDGWLYTGDIARMDEDGYFSIVDRKKDMVLIGGFNVYPTNIEKALKDHPAVADVGVAGIPHPEKTGQEALKAWVVLAPDTQVTAQELKDFLREKLAPYEVPHSFEFVAELPKTAAFKILRRELVKMEMEGSKDKSAAPA